MQKPTDYMHHALTLAKSGLGRVHPNPAVGCVLVNNNMVVGASRTNDGGRPHAEAGALAMAGILAKGAVAYVTLEPCAHIGETPSCADSLINAGIIKCYVATLDPDPRTSGRGVQKLTDAGISVEVGLLQDKANDINQGFFSVFKKKRPMFCAKIAQSMDGKIALSNKQSKWITGDKARSYGHFLRASYDAILVGTGTVKADDPSLDCRLNGCEEQSPIRIIIGSNIAENAKILTDGGQTHILTGDVESIAIKLAEMGLTRVLIEGGATIITAFMQANLIDNIAIFTAPKVLGADSYNAVGELSVLEMQNVAHYSLKDSKILGEDTYTLLARN